jgi:streptomycin 6-kinase
MSRTFSVVTFDPWLHRWSLTVDGSPIPTACSDLLPVVRNGVPAMLKIARTQEERRGASLLDWYAGDGAVRVLEIEGPALLMERPRGDQSLAELSHSDRDDQATKILCATVQKLHTHRDRPPPGDLVPLDVWFRSLTSTVNPLLARSLAIARELLADERRPIHLHGDIHHGNVLYDNDRGWLAIDPKGLRGEDAFDYSNIFCNPDFVTATARAVFFRRLEIVSEAAAVDRRRMLKWVLAYAGLSAAWGMEDGDGVELRLAIVEMASRELGG